MILILYIYLIFFLKNYNKNLFKNNTILIKDINIFNNIKKNINNNKFINYNNIYIKYNNNNNIKSIIDFDNKNIIIETYYNKFYKKFIIYEILNILYIYNFNFFSYNFYNNKNNILDHKKIFFNNLKLNLNNNNNYNNYLYFAKFIVNFKLNYKFINSSKVYYVVISFNNIKLYNILLKYINKIYFISKKFNIDIILILSIIKIESNFNKYALSNSGAIGIMQIIYNTAALDFFNNMYFNIKPNKCILFNSLYNLIIGIGYLNILQNKYFLNIKDKDSLRYLTIASYNGGIYNIIKIFNNNFNKSINIINNMNSKLVYKSIVNYHPSKEVRNYLKKVNDLYIKYNKYKNIFIFIK